MVVELISVGTELLLGNIVNTNAAFLAEECARLGLNCYYQTVVGDNEERLTDTVRTALSRADVIILSGGLGPTQDDLTKEVTSKVMGRKLVEDEHAKTAIEQFFKSKGIAPADNNWKQAMVPEGATVLYNENGTAPGVIIKDNGKVAIMLPGPPNELVPMFLEQVVPYLKVMLPGTIYSKTVKIVGVGESSVEKMIEDIIDNQSNPTIATYAKTGEVQIRVTVSASDEQEAKKLVKPVIKLLKERLGDHIYSTDENTSLEKAVVDILMANDLTIATAESCTGGLLAGRLTNVPGVSENFKTGVITYSNKSKRKLLGVKKPTLDKYTAISEQVAAEMARGIHNLTKADVTVATTGLAGPDGGTETQPVGLVYISCFVCGRITTKEYHFSGNRAKIREAAVAAALSLLRTCILEYYSEATFGKL